MSYEGFFACGFCGNRNGSLNLCGACRAVRYCNSDHQRKHWKAHKPTCANIKRRSHQKQNLDLLYASDVAHSDFNLSNSLLDSVFNDQLEPSSLPTSNSLLDSSLLEPDLSTPIESNMGVEMINSRNPTEHHSSLYQLKLTQSLTDHLKPEWLTNVTNYLLHDLNQFGFSVIDNFLGMELANHVLDEVHQLHSGGLLTDGQVVSHQVQTSTLIRGDKITWISGLEVGCAAITKLVSTINGVVAYANKHENAGLLKDYTIAYRTRAMVACYPGCGTRYVKHVDNPDGDGRCITAIYYINREWKVDDGGVLRIYPRGSKVVAQIEPLFDRMLFFWSDRRNPHEVLPSTHTRYAITVWYLDQRQREQYHRRCYQQVGGASTSATQL